MRNYLFVLLFVLFSTSVTAEVFITHNQSLFDEGNYTNAFFNNETRTLQLNLSSNVSFGDYVSNVYTANTTAYWINFTWTEDLPYGEQLPDNQITEDSIGGVNMSGNALLLHLDNATTIQDSSGNDNSGNITGDPTVSGGIFSNAVTFDGDSDSIIIPNSQSTNFTDVFTLETWVYAFDDGSQAQRMNDPGIGLPFVNNGIYKKNDYGIVPTPSAITAYVHTERVGASITDGWHHVVLTYDQYKTSNQLALYIDGNLTVTSDITRPPKKSSNPLIIGQKFNGSVDELALYSRALNPQEILARYQRGILDLAFNVKSCDVLNCGDTSWQTTYITSPQILNLTNTTSIQYLGIFNTSHLLYSPHLYNVTINYVLIVNTTYDNNETNDTGDDPPPADDTSDDTGGSSDNSPLSPGSDSGFDKAALAASQPPAPAPVVSIPSLSEPTVDLLHEESNSPPSPLTGLSVSDVEHSRSLLDFISGAFATPISVTTNNFALLFLVLFFLLIEVSLRRQKLLSPESHLKSAWRISHSPYTFQVQKPSKQKTSVTLDTRKINKAKNQRKRMLKELTQVYKRG